VVVERAALLAEGDAFPIIMGWILAQGGTVEAPATPRQGGGLHGPAGSERSGAAAVTPQRFVLPADALVESEPTQPPTDGST
jgi:hypothetical protein